MVEEEGTKFTVDQTLGGGKGVINYRAYLETLGKGWVEFFDTFLESVFY